MEIHAKQFILPLLVILALPMVFADSQNYNFETVEINDIIAYLNQPTNLSRNLNLEQLETITVELTIKASQNISGGFVDFVRCRSTLEGYEFGSVSDETPVFTVEQGNVYKKVMNINVPEDIETSEPYTLRLECSDPQDQEQLEFTVFLNEIRHFLRIFDVLLNPSNNIQAGKPLFVTVRLENRGQKEQDDIKVVVSVPELGISSSNFLNELVTVQQERTEQWKFEEESSGQLDLLLRIPEDAPTGDYNVNVEAIYNRGHSRVATKVPLRIEGIEPEVEDKVESIINIDSTVKQVNAGEEATYRLMIANLGNKKGIYSIQIDGTSPWATASAEPGFLTVLPEGTGEALIRVKTASNAEAGDHFFTAKVMLGSEVINEVNLNTRVNQKMLVSAAPITFKSVLIGTFGLLVIVLIILGLVIAFKRSSKQEEEAPALTEGQTYYYHPKK